MKIRNSISMALAVIVILLSTGCVEHRYYRQNHRHSERYERRHHGPTERVDIDIHH
jgi:hypothetical protein